MSFILSNSFVQKLSDMSPLQPVTIIVTWWDDDKGKLAQITVRHRISKQKYHRLEDKEILAYITKQSTNQSVFNEIKSKMRTNFGGETK